MLHMNTNLKPAIQRITGRKDQSHRHRTETLLTVDKSLVTDCCLQHGTFRIHQNTPECYTLDRKTMMPPGLTLMEILKESKNKLFNSGWLEKKLRGEEPNPLPRPIDIPEEWQKY